MAKVKRIFLGHGELKDLAQAVGKTTATTSRYLKGYYDETNLKTVAEAEKVRSFALKHGGIIER